MDVQEVIRKFNSEDAHAIFLATWDVLYCSDKEKLLALRPHVSTFRRSINRVDLGGMFYSNKSTAELALAYIERSNSDVCRCKLFEETSQFSPNTEEKRGQISILGSVVRKALFEEQFDVLCNSCGKRYFVREVHGWHVPWYEWKSG